jgi:hypothetical protein
MCFFLLQEPQPIDWEYYRKGIGSKVVDMYKQAYESEHPFTATLFHNFLKCFCLFPHTIEFNDLSCSINYVVH